MKKEIRILGIDDSSFKKKQIKEILVIATVFRGDSFLDGILSTKIKVDGDDSTKKLIQMINKTKHKGQLQMIMLNGIALGGFNIIDIKQLSQKTRLPVIVLMRKYPNIKEIFQALNHLKNPKQKQLLIKKAGKIYEIKIKNKKIYAQLSNISLQNAKKIIKISAIHSLIPEPLRIAHLIASGISLGENKGRV